ncbi:hypothetical protein AK812_SmicGene11997 [Symbiodinium microadriaticum]|uniref:Uncharacterized protein n=1 Tax=Symbiodinium microadriaticum TaxID=2951 RepID=A0A1Q9EBS8_SYMMI|nr:hypothetical protein AK812_SmicGene11997 [Symbiodinium microadriaticum]CAE7364340.1 unnamed protein product [Symbiodinium microadriaticum]
MSLPTGGSGIQVDLFVNGRRSLQKAPLSNYRFEGYVHPEAYLDKSDASGRPVMKVLRSAWAESIEEVGRALISFASNRSLRRSVGRRKARRFRLGSRPYAPRPASVARAMGTNVSRFLERLGAAGIALEGSFLNIGANDGIGDDPLAHYAQSSLVKESGAAVAIEADEGLCVKHRRNLPWVALHCGFAVPSTLRSLLAPLPWRSLDVLKVDIDSCDGLIVDECVHRLGWRPKVIQVEVNAGFPPPLQYSLLDSPLLREHLPYVEVYGPIFGDKEMRLQVNSPIAGTSLSYYVQHLWPVYVLWDIASPDAIFLRADLAEVAGVEALDEFHAFAWSWADIHNFHRDLVRRWTFELDAEGALGEAFQYMVDWMKQNLGIILPFHLGL